ncbi:hypothetical protein MHU86_19121 [Fragilaria crotonensis]|nr:hypothetical protein MHU86_19121 [Fragilaria crotonensis]
METHIARQVQEALSENRRQQQPQVPPSNAEQEFRAFMLNNNRHMQMLTEMVMQMMNATSSIPVTNTRNDHAQAVGAKRAEESSGDEGEDDGDYTQDTRAHSTTTVMARKRRNTRTSPHKMPASSGRMFHERFSDPQLSPPAFDTSVIHREKEVFPVINRNTSSPPLNPYCPDPPSPIYPDHPDHPLHECHPELSLDSSGLVAADEVASPRPVSHFEAMPGELNDTDMSDEFLRDIQEQHTDETQQPLIPSAVSHEEMANAALHSPNEDDNGLAQTRPGELSALTQSQ